MKLGLLSAILPEYSFQQVIDFCAETGFEALEVACWPNGKAQRRYAGVTHLDIANAAPGEIESQIRYARDRGIEISAFAYYPNPLSSIVQESSLAVTHIKKLIEAASENGVPLVNTFIGRDRFKTVDENLRLYKETWSPIIEFAEKHHIKIGIENCPMLFTQDEWPGGNNLAASPALWQEMFRLIDSGNLGLNYDPSHCVIWDMDYIKPLYDFKDKIFHIHLKDTRIYRDKLDQVGRMAYPLQYMAPKLPGLGDIDWSRFCSTLYDIGYTGVACIEIEDKAFEENDRMVRRGIALAYKNVSPYF